MEKALDGKRYINYKNNTISDLIYSMTSSFNDTDIILSASILADPVESRMLAGQDSVSWGKKIIVRLDNSNELQFIKV